MNSGLLVVHKRVGHAVFDQGWGTGQGCDPSQENSKCQSPEPGGASRRPVVPGLPQAHPFLEGWDGQAAPRTPLHTQILWSGWDLGGVLESAGPPSPATGKGSYGCLLGPHDHVECSSWWGHGTLTPAGGGSLLQGASGKQARWQLHQGLWWLTLGLGRGKGRAQCAGGSAGASVSLREMPPLVKVQSPGPLGRGQGWRLRTPQVKGSSQSAHLGTLQSWAPPLPSAR